MYRILFVCLGNICRSSAAEEIMRQKLQSNGLENKVSVDSCGLIDYHEGELSDSRMRFHAKNRGYILTHRSRPICSSDFHTFDLIIGMDDSNIQRLLRLSPTPTASHKIHKMTEYITDYDVESVPDPYYGSDSAFEYALDLLENGCDGLLQSLEL